LNGLSGLKIKSGKNGIKDSADILPIVRFKGFMEGAEAV